MANPLLDLLSGVGNVLDTPGSVVRGLLAGKAGSALGGILDPSQRVSGRDLLNQWGVTDDNSGILGDIGGFAAQVATDPLTWVGGSLARNLLRGAGKAVEGVGEAATAAGRAATAAEATGAGAGRASTLLEAAPGVGGYKKLADGTIERISPLPASATRGIGPTGASTFVAPQPQLNIAEEWSGRRVSPTFTPTVANDAATLPYRQTMSDVQGLGRASSSGSVSNLLPLRRDITVVKDAGLDLAGRPTGVSVGGNPENARRALAEYAFTANDVAGQTAAHYPTINTTVLPEGTGLGTARHEMLHGLINRAIQTGDTSALPALPRMVAESQTSPNRLIQALGHVGEEAVAHGAESRGRLQQLRNMISYLANPSEGYVRQFGAYSPLGADIYGSAAIPRLGLAGYGFGAAGGAGLLAALGGGQ